MDISIAYCNEWNYLPRAASMASNILKKYGNGITSLTMIPSSGWVYDVTKKNNLIFSKKNEGRFPELDEIYALLESST